MPLDLWLKQYRARKPSKPYVESLVQFDTTHCLLTTRASSFIDVVAQGRKNMLPAMSQQHHQKPQQQQKQQQQKHQHGKGKSSGRQQAWQSKQVQAKIRGIHFAVIYTPRNPITPSSWSGIFEFSNHRT